MLNTEKFNKVSLGDLDYIEHLYAKTFAALLQYTRYIVIDKGGAEDAVQDAFLIAYLHIDKLKESTNPEGWLYKTLQFVVCRKNRIEKKAKALLEKMTTAEVLPTSEIFESNSLLFMACRDLLKAGDWELLEGHCVEGRTYDELSKQTGISVPACKMRISRAKQLLNTKLKLDVTINIK